MTYNISRKVVERKRSYLEAMYAGRRTMTWPSREADKLARQIREAMTAVQHHKEYDRYVPLKTLYKIHSRKGFVEAVWHGEEEGVAVEVSSLPSFPETLYLDDITDLAGAVGAAIKYAAEADELVLTSVVLTEEEKLTLYRWTQQDNLWKFIDQFEAGITLTRKAVDSILVWKPDST